MLRRALTGIVEPSYLGQDDYGITPNYSQQSFLNFPSIGLPESPETASARRVPRANLAIMNEESKRRHYNISLGISRNIINTFFNGLPSESHDDIYDVDVELREKKEGFFFSKNAGMTITFHRRKK